MVKTITVSIPAELAGTPFEQAYLDAMQQISKEQVVLRLYREHQISTVRGARLLGMSIYDFIQFLSRHQVSIFSYAEGELAADMKATQMAKNIAD